MVQPMGGLPYAQDVDLAALAKAQAESQATGDDAFSQALESAIETVRQQSGNGSQSDTNANATVTGGAEASGSAASSSGAQAASAANGASTSSSSSASSSSSSSASAGSGNTRLTAAQLAAMTPADAYWAQQPPAVQQLRYMPDDERGGYAEMLAAEGYTIDVPIMVDNMDPLACMIMREQDGYTWVPSALQKPVECGPGIVAPGYVAYDPNNPPPGSIMVSTAFALGTNMQDAVVSAPDMQKYVLGGSSSSSSGAQSSGAAST